MIKFSCSDYTFPLLTPAQRFALLRLPGFKYVDIGPFERSEGLRPGQPMAEPRDWLLNRIRERLPLPGKRPWPFPLSTATAAAS
jgi:hypothetical protein